MITEQGLKDKCTPDIIKRMVELAEGFSNYEYNHSLNRAIFDSIYHDVLDIRIFPLLVYRAVEGWNKSKHTVERIDDYSIRINEQRLFYMYNEYATPYDYANYQPESLTHAECAMLHCLLDVFKQEERDDNI